MGDHGDYWRDVGPFLREQGQQKRAKNRQSSLDWLCAQGFDPEVKNDGAHIIIRVGSIRFDLWPGTGKWVRDLNHGKQRRGVRGLLKALHRERKALEESCG